MCVIISDAIMNSYCHLLLSLKESGLLNYRIVYLVFSVLFRKLKTKSIHSLICLSCKCGTEQRIDCFADYLNYLRYNFQQLNVDSN